MIKVYVTFKHVFCCYFENANYACDWSVARKRRYDYLPQRTTAYRNGLGLGLRWALALMLWVRVRIRGNTCSFRYAIANGHCKRYRATGPHKAGVEVDMTPPTGGPVGHPPNPATLCDLIMGGHFRQILDLFQVLKIGVPNGCLGETSVFKIVMIDDVTLWSKLESTWQVFSILLILFHRGTIFKMLASE